jgi:2-iminobutanoate/2-iminopropanoate deaminase
MNRAVNPAAMAAPAAAYSHAVVSDPGAHWLHTSGVVPVAADGSVPADLGEQASLVWDNLAAMCAEAGCALADTVSVTTYVVAGNDLAVVMAARDRAMAGHRPASTLVTVPALARPEWLMEIALVASW